MFKRSAAQDSSPGISDSFNPGNMAAISGQPSWWLLYSIFGNNGGGSVYRLFSKETDKSTRRRLVNFTSKISSRIINRACTPSARRGIQSVSNQRRSRTIMTQTQLAGLGCTHRGVATEQCFQAFVRGERDELASLLTINRCQGVNDLGDRKMQHRQLPDALLPQCCFIQLGYMQEVVDTAAR